MEIPNTLVINIWITILENSNSQRLKKNLLYWKKKKKKKEGIFNST